MHTVLRQLVVAALCLHGLSSPAWPAKATPCPGGRFTVTTPALVMGGTVTPGGTLSITGTGGGVRVALGTACSADQQLAARWVAKRKGTLLKVVWSGCTGAEGRVRLRGLLDAGSCATFAGTLRARGIRMRLAASRTPVVCGDGIVDQGEACDPLSETPACSAGQGCVRSDEQCGCAPLCSATAPSADALAAAIAAALAAHPDAFTSVAGFDGLRGAVQAALGCALNTGSLQRVQPDPLPAPGGYNSAVQYCGPGDSTEDWRLGLAAPDSCLNVACYEHDRCTPAAGADCDAALVRACEACTGSAAGTLFSWLTPDSFVLCSALRAAVGTPASTSTTTTTVPPSTLPGATSTSTSSSTATTAPGATSSTAGPAPSTSTSSTSSTAAVPTVTTTSSTTTSTASAEGKDLIPEHIVFDAPSVAAGGKLKVTWDVTNHGTVAVTEDFCDKLYLSADALVDAGDTFLDSQCHFGVYGSGQGDTRSLDLTIPATAPKGPAYVVIDTDVQFTVTEGNETNNVAAAGFTIE